MTTSGTDKLPWADEAVASEPPATIDAPLLEPLPELPPVQAFLVVDGDGVVVSAGFSNLAQDGGTWVSEAVLEDARHRVGLCKLVDGALVDHAPTPLPDPMPLAVPKLGLVRALMAVGRWPRVRDALQADVDLLFQWNAAGEIALADPMTKGVIASLGLTDGEVVALMRAAMAPQSAA